MGKIFNRGLTEEGKQEELLKSVKIIGEKNEELLKAFSAANKVSKAAKNESDFNYDSLSTLFTSSTETLKQMMEWCH